MILLRHRWCRSRLNRRIGLLRSLSGLRATKVTPGGPIVLLSRLLLNWSNVRVNILRVARRGCIEREQVSEALGWFHLLLFNYWLLLGLEDLLRDRFFWGGHYRLTYSCCGRWGRSQSSPATGLLRLCSREVLTTIAVFHGCLLLFNRFVIRRLLFGLLTALPPPFFASLGSFLLRVFAVTVDFILLFKSLLDVFGPEEVFNLPGVLLIRLGVLFLRPTGHQSSPLILRKEGVKTVTKRV